MGYARPDLRREAGRGKWEADAGRGSTRKYAEPLYLNIDHFSIQIQQV